MRKYTSIISDLILALLLVGFTIISFHAGIKEYEVSLHLTPTQGVVLSSKVEKEVEVIDTGATGPAAVEFYSPDINYSYRVNNNEYSGNRFSPIKRRIGNKSRVERIVSNYHVGNKVKVWYDLRQPMYAVLNKDTSFMPWLLGLISMAGLFGICRSIKKQIIQNKFHKNLIFNIRNTIFLISLIFAIPAYAEQSGGNTIKTSAPEKGELIIEDVYNYILYKYEPIIKVDTVSKPAARGFTTPEEAAISHFSAMFSGDYEWFLGTWDEKSQLLMKHENAERKNSADYWVAIWKKVLKNRTAWLTARIETGSYVLIEYKLTGGKGKDFVETLPMKQDKNGKWLLTQELAGDPLNAFWKSRESNITRIKRVMR